MAIVDLITTGIKYFNKNYSVYHILIYLLF
jgi:hypothetical protein